jgi:hypothetical protein
MVEWPQEEVASLPNWADLPWPDPKPPFFHCSPLHFPDGHLLTSPASRGEAPRWDVAAKALAGRGHLIGYDAEAVYILTHQNDDPQSIVGYWLFSQDPVYLYLVEPIGDVWRDPERTNTGWCWCCHEARIIECLHEPPRQ